MSTSCIYVYYIICERFITCNDRIQKYYYLDETFGLFLTIDFPMSVLDKFLFLPKILTFYEYTLCKTQTYTY